MYSLSVLIIVSIVCLVLGGVAGYFAGRLFSTDKKGFRAMEARANQAEEQLKQFQNDVTEHFKETSVLVNKLTENYKDVHEHLAAGAIKLANADIGRDLLDSASKQWAQSDHHRDLLADETQVQPPRDWAPNNGTLSESFGLESSSEIDSTLSDKEGEIIDQKTSKT